MRRTIKKIDTPIHNKSNKIKPLVFQIFLIFLRLGFTSFGGPIAAIGYFREEFVEKRGWLHEHTYADLVALCQLLPGPASSQVAISIGLLKAGYLGALASWVGFVFPSSIFLVLFGLTLSSDYLTEHAGWIQGTKTVAVAVVAQAVLRMGKILCPDKIRILFAIIAAIITLSLANPLAQVCAILSGGLLGWLFLKDRENLPSIHISIPIGKCSAILSLSLFLILLFLLPFAAKFSNNPTLSVFNSFFRTGALVLGGAHVVLPLLQSVVVPANMISNDLFLAGYGIAQAIPGPLLSFAAYLGAVSKIPPNGWYGALVCLIGIYLPSFLLLIGLLPFWKKIRHYQSMKVIMQGLNASVVGLLLAALYNPLWVNSIHNLKDFIFGLTAFICLNALRWPSWVVVPLGASFGQIFL